MGKKHFFYLLLISLLITARTFSDSPVDSTTLDASLHSGGYTTNLSLDSTKIYILKGYLFIQSGASIYIPSGTWVKGDKLTKGCLIINRGAKIYANGTSSRPVVFTSRSAPGSRAAGDWGGLIIIGKATINTYPGADTAICEGIVPDVYYGGHDDNDNSGYLHYVRSEFAGVALSPNNEINGITFYSVGRGTVIDHLMVSYSGDDSYEWFGGTVNIKYLVAYNGLDDSFDDSFGFRGRVQYILDVRVPAIADVSKSHGWESDNNEFAQGSTTLFNANSPRTQSLWSNMTIIGPKEFDTSTVNTLYESAILERRWSLRSAWNSIFMGYPKGYIFDRIGVIQAAIGDTLKFRSNILSGMLLNWDSVGSNGTFSPTAWGMDPSRQNDTFLLNSQVMLNNPYSSSRSFSNYMPQGGSPVFNHVTNNMSSVDPFFDDVTYRGALNSVDWGAGWTNWRPDTVDYNTLPPIGIQPISNIVPAHYSLYQNYPNPFNPQTTIKFDITSSGIATLKIFDILGREIAVLANNSAVNAGTYKADFDATNLASGIYFYRIVVQSTKGVEWTESKKMMLVK